MVGVLFIEQFDARITFLFLLLGVTSACCSSVAYNLVRTLREREHPWTVVFHFQIVGLAVSLGFTLFDWQTPRGWDWLYLFLIGAFSQLGQIFLPDALQNIESLLGMLLVVCGVVLSVVYSKRRKTLRISN